MSETYKTPGGGTKGIPGKPGVAPTPSAAANPSTHETDTTRWSAITEYQESTRSNQSEEAITVKQPPVNITLTFPTKLNARSY